MQRFDDTAGRLQFPLPPRDWSPGQPDRRRHGRMPFAAPTEKGIVITGFWGPDVRRFSFDRIAEALNEDAVPSQDVKVLASGRMRD